MKALRLMLLSTLLAIVLAAPGYAWMERESEFNSYRSSNTLTLEHFQPVDREYHYWQHYRPWPRTHDYDSSYSYSYAPAPVYEPSFEPYDKPGISLDVPLFSFNFGF